MPAGSNTLDSNTLERIVADPATVARWLAPTLRWPDAGATPERQWKLVARTPRFDAWLIAWPPGGQVALHDHGPSAGAISVIDGALTEAVPWRDAFGRLSLARRELHAGMTMGFAAGHVHDVTNESGRHALSLHVYSPALTYMTRYDLTADGLVAGERSWTAATDVIGVWATARSRSRPLSRRVPVSAGGRAGR
jgi:predicted metal-dependent enzyme (double-stranded beta helix superfamily)